MTMKKISVVLSLVFVILVNFQIAAQEAVPKELLLSGLNSVAHLKLENKQVTNLIEYNKGFVDEIYEVLDGDQEEKAKKKSLKALSEKREIDLRDIIGKSKTKKYLKMMEDELRPLGKKEKLLKEIINT